MQRDYNNKPLRRPADMSVGKWLGTFIILMIPIVGFIAYLVWLFGGGKNRTRTNFIRASLIIFIIVMIISAVFLFILLDKVKAILDENFIISNVPTYDISLLLPSLL